MHQVQCPKCRRMLKVEVALHSARLRCRHCGHVFLASTAADRPEEPPSQAPETFAWPEPSPAARNPVPSRLVMAGRQKARPVARLVIAICCGVAIIPIIIGVIYFGTTQTIEVVYDNGTRVVERVSRSQAQQRIEELKNKDSSSGEPTRPARPSHKETPEEMHNKPIEPGKEFEPGAYAEAKLRGDADVQILGNKPLENEVDPTQGEIVGTVRSSHREALRTLKVAFEICDTDGKVAGRSTTATLEWVPSGAIMNYSVQYNVSPEGRKLQGLAESKIVDPDTVCWYVDDVSKIDRQDTVISISGTIVNPYEFDVHELEVYADFFTREGIRVGTMQQVKLENSGRLGPMLKRNFKLRWDVQDDVKARLVDRYNVRAVARK